MATSKVKQTEVEREEARADLRNFIKPGDRIFTVLRHVSRSGMYRTLDVYQLGEDSPRWLSRLVGRATGIRFDEKRQALGVSGCGMDVGFQVVYELGMALFPDGFECIGDNERNSLRCPSNDHFNGDRNYKPHHHKSGGYALRHSWM